MLKFSTGFVLALLLAAVAYFSWLRKPANETPNVTSSQKTDHAELVYNLCKKLPTHKASPLTEDEMSQFAASIVELSYDDTLLASKLIEPDPEEVILTPDITPGEPRDNSPEFWEKPAELIAARLLEIAPVHTSRYIQTAELDYDILDGVGFRCARKFVIMFGREKPKLAWQETQRHYEKFWNLFEKDSLHRIPQMASATFHGLWQRDPVLAQKYLFDESYADQPWQARLQKDALHGILLATEHDPDKLEKFISWLENDGFKLPDQLPSHSFPVNLSSFNSIDHMALALLAKIDPQRAIKFAEQDENPRLVDWPYAIYAGWVEFWPYRQRDMEQYLTRDEDAMTWLTQHAKGDLGETYAHNAFFSWISDNSDATLRWLYKPTKHPLEKQRKAYLLKTFQETKWGRQNETTR